MLLLWQESVTSLALFAELSVGLLDVKRFLFFFKFCLTNFNRVKLVLMRTTQLLCILLINPVAPLFQFMCGVIVFSLPLPSLVA